jgi:NAD(P)-dependent dehydrogenase (short-subunit alcohol dehydrogenase family)
MSNLLSGKTAVVTGASSGIGRAIAMSFAAEGANLVVADVREDPLEGGEPTVACINRAGGEACFSQADVRCWDGVDRTISMAVERYGRLDIMINNAAIFSGTGLLESSEADWERVMGVNMTGMFYGCKRAVQQMITQEPLHEVRGRIINLGSQQGVVNSPRDTAYGVSKAGAIYITKQIAVDYAKQLIVCNCISPGKVITGKPGLPMDPALLENARRRTPWPRLGRPEDIANAAVFLASDQATFITGTNLVVDGGWLAA